MRKINPIIIVAIIFAGCAFSSLKVPYDKQSFHVKDKELQTTILKFYDNLYKKRIDKMYSMESPSFRYLYPFEKYKAYYSGFKKFKKISFVSLHQEAPNVYESQIKIVFPDTTVLYKDIWLKIGDKYFHNTRDIFFFPY